MKKSIIIASIVIILALIGGGVFWYVKKGEDKSKQALNNEENLNKEAEFEDVEKNNLETEFVPASDVENIDVAKQADTSDWLTYRNEEYGFELKYPEEWSKDNDINHPFYIKNTRHNESPITLSENDHAMTLTKTKLEQMKKFIESSTDSNIFLIDNKIKALSDVNYEVPSGSFYKKIQFFIGNDLIELSVSFPLGPYTWPDDKNTINNLLQKIKENSANATVLGVNNKFAEIVETVNFFK